jgi:hypothetical protein
LACWNAFLQAETTDIERIAVCRIRRSYWKKHPPREEWERALRDEYAAERRCDEDRAAALRMPCLDASLGVATTAIEAIARERVASHLKVVQ